MKSGSIPISSSASTRRRGLLICCGVTALILIVAASIIVTLAFTVFKPKEPEITARPAGLENIEYSLSPNVTVNVTVDMIITIDNGKNYGSFKFKNTTAYVNYRGDVVAQVPIKHSLVPARGKLNITSPADFMLSKVISNPSFSEDFLSGSLNLTSMATLHGKVGLFKVVKMQATAFSTCDISVFVIDREVQSKCESKLKL
ncbi:Late embryogenesis abundant protein [Trema orientale]|uniref:Late embryogenesis abundant protein n=1 Tax=Trema orientale TaxID=63057 RepID=A0A2P5FVQ5_TREOI|nr:Late embryogenesis abundant protein [Trema orientale]